MNNNDQIQILIGTATCGRSAGSLEVINSFREEIAKHQLKANIMETGCYGLCYAEPLVTIIKPGRPEIWYKNVTPDKVKEITENYLINDNPITQNLFGTTGKDYIEGITNLDNMPVLNLQVRRILSNCGVIDPTDINSYLAKDGYKALTKAIFEMSPQTIIAEIEKSGLRGLGGAGFPTGRKWEACRKAVGEEKYVICNADEGDPGAFQDRSVLEGDPHSVIEGMIIAGYAVGAKEGYIYVRAEYPLAVERLNMAIFQAREKGFLGKNILGSGFDFELKIFKGAGAFVCGESTALILSIEGKRGMPKPLPRSRTTEEGLWGKPTLLNNVKTFANIKWIINEGSEWFSSIGTANSKGTAVFSITGKVKNCGLIEVPMGTTLRQIVFDIGGGIPEGKTFKAVQTGGPSGGCLPESLLDTPVDFDSLTAAGSIMGSGGLVVMDEDTCMVDVARYFLDFTQKESCGKCVPCKFGSKELLDILNDICEGKGREGDIETLIEIAETMVAGCICGLGQSAPNPVLTTIRYFRDEYEAHIKEKKCPAKVCKSLIQYKILEDRCKACTLCLKACPAEAITGAPKQIHKIIQDKCVKCGICIDYCPPRFKAIVRTSEGVPAISQS